MIDVLAGLAVVAAVAVTLPFMWWFMLNLIARVGGWTRLAETFTSRSEPKGEHFSWRSGSIGWLGGYRHVLEVWVSPNGLWLRPTGIFRLGHQTLMIPWTAVARVGRRTFLLKTVSDLGIRLPGGRTLTVSLYGEDLAESINRQAPQGATAPLSR